MSSAIQRDVDRVRELSGHHSCDLAIILGSGLGEALSGFDCSTSLGYADLESVPAGLVVGHSGTLTVCRLDHLRLLVFRGRFHCYQGLSAFEAAWPVRLSAELGIRHLLLTSAVGGIASELMPGDFVLVRDHLNLMGDNPLRGLSPPAFIDLVGLYQPLLYPLLKPLARTHGIVLHHGVLAALSGPSYETPAEIEMLRLLGADIVSMSMVPEAIMARSLGMKMLGLALVSNLAAGLADATLNHADVVAAGQAGGGRLAGLLPDLIRLYLSHQEPSS
jgi:purine-nucleoside phosphorylase